MKEIVLVPPKLQGFALGLILRMRCLARQERHVLLTKTCYYRFENLWLSVGKIINDINYFVASPVRFKVMLHETIHNDDF